MFCCLLIQIYASLVICCITFSPNLITDSLIRVLVVYYHQYALRVRAIKKK